MIVPIITLIVIFTLICCLSGFDTYRNYIVKPEDYIHRPFFRRSFYRYPFFNKRYVNRPVLDGLV